MNRRDFLGYLIATSAPFSGSAWEKFGEEPKLAASIPTAFVNLADTPNFPTSMWVETRRVRYIISDYDTGYGEGGYGVLQSSLMRREDMIA